MAVERRVEMQVDKNGWVQVPGWIQIKPALPSAGRVLGVKSVGGVVHVMQESERGPVLYRFRLGEGGAPSAWEEIRPGEVQ
jgi:hypothetical protein